MSDGLSCDSVVTMAAKQLSVDWYEIESRFRAGQDPKQIAKEFKVKLNTLMARSRRKDWKPCQKANVTPGEQNAEQAFALIASEAKSVADDNTLSPTARRAKMRELLSRHNELLIQALLKSPPKHIGEVKVHAEIGQKVTDTADVLYGFSEEHKEPFRLISIEAMNAITPAENDARLREMGILPELEPVIDVPTEPDPAAAVAAELREQRLAEGPPPA